MGDWRFLLDENVDPKVESYLAKEGITAEHVRDSLGQGAADETDVLPYARDHELIVVTSDVSDFGALDSERTPGVVLLFDDTTPAYRIAAGLIAMVDAYPSVESFGGREELDAWIR